MANSHLTIKHSMPEDAFGHAVRMAKLLSTTPSTSTSGILVLDIPIPTTPSGRDELISFLSFTPSLGAAVADALEASEVDVTHLTMHVCLDKDAQPENSFPAQVGERLHKVLPKKLMPQSIHLP